MLDVARVQRYMMFQLCGYIAPCAWLAVAMSKPHSRVSSAACRKAAARGASQHTTLESSAHVTSYGLCAR